MKRYYSLNDYLQDKYGQKVYKLALDAGFTCPNRDGTKGFGGCTFCLNGGSGHFAKPTLAEAKAFLKNKKEEVDFRETQISHMQYDSDTRSGLAFPAPDTDAPEEEFAPADAPDEAVISADAPDEAFEYYEKEPADSQPTYGEGWVRQTKNVGEKYIAYFQTYSNTYAPVEKLREIYRPAMEDDEIVGLAIATRPDCLPADVLDLLEQINRVKPVWVELGLQTIHDATAEKFGRGYPLSVFDEAVSALRERNLDVVVHLIMGLPGETLDDMLASVKYVSNCDIQGIKIHMLTILKGTPLGDQFEAATAKLDQSEGIVQMDTKLTFSDGTDYPFITLDKYADLICACIGLLRPDIVIHRLTGDGPKDRLLSPMWTADKKRVLNLINLHLERRGITQGCLRGM